MLRGPEVLKGLFHFKRTFGGRELEYGVSGQIIDQDRYQAQIRQRAVACDVTADALVELNFFPAYRAGTVRTGTVTAGTVRT